MVGYVFFINDQCPSTIIKNHQHNLTVFQTHAEFKLHLAARTMYLEKNMIILFCKKF